MNSPDLKRPIGTAPYPDVRFWPKADMVVTGEWVRADHFSLSVDRAHSVGDLGRLQLLWKSSHASLRRY